MLDRQRLVQQSEGKREELFAQRYERLLGWAMQLTNQHRPSAEDLVQDAFVQFALGHTSLDVIENLDGYLRRMLRYMHISRTYRSTQQAPDLAISIADYDSINVSCQGIEPSRRMQAQEELYQICAYATSRKEFSRAGSVLILRFFHDYYPSEIVKVIRSSRHSVDEWQHVARREVKLLLSDPGRLRFTPATPSIESLRQREPMSDCDLMYDLRQMIFRSRQGDCLAGHQLRELYESGEAVSTTQLAHTVSCADCLDEVNALLNLPLLAARYHNDRCEDETPPHDRTGGPSGRTTTDLTTKHRRRLQEVGEHKPKELRITVNGALLSSLKVSSETNEVNLNLGQDERVDFVEVFSEQGVQLLFFDATQTTEQWSEQWVVSELSERRTLKACLRFENGPCLQVIYEEPAFESADVPSPLKLIGTLSSTSSSPFRRGEYEDFRSRIRQLLRAMVTVLRKAVLRQNSSASTANPPLQVITGPSSDEVFPSLQLGYQASARSFWTRPGYVTALVLLITTLAIVYYGSKTTPILTATNLLEKASVAEEVGDQMPDQATHRVINLEERRSTEGAVVARRKIEIWQNAISGNRTRRVFDENNRLIAGAWQKANGPQSVFHHSGKPRPQSSVLHPDDVLLNLEDIWQLEPSAKVFSTLVAGGGGAELEERTAGYVISYAKERAIGASRLLKATLTLSRADLHAIEQTLLVERGGEVREYRFVEASFERLPSKSVNPAVFEVEPELLGKANRDGKPGKPANPADAASVDRVSVAASLPRIASAELEVDVAYLLNQAKADRSEQIALSRLANGSLRVEGVVDSTPRKEELLRVLAPVSHNPAVKIEIRSVTEVADAEARGRSGAVTFRDAEDTVDAVAVDAELRDYLSGKDGALKTGDRLDEAVRALSSRVVNHAYRALFHTIELRRLLNRFAGVDMHTVTPDARAKWLEMVRDHAAALEHETGFLRAEIQPIFFSGIAVKTDELQIASDADLARAVADVHKLALANNEAIRASFTISSQSSNAVKSIQFWRTLNAVERLAARIKQYGG